jgi:tetratricopeptide (TPR) repeat protein
LALADVAGQAALIGALVVLTAIALVRWPRAGFAGAWALLTLAPTSSLIPIVTEVGAERRMYLPLMAIVALVVAAAAALPWRLSSRQDGESRAGRTARVAGAVMLVAATIALAVGTVARNREYRSAITLGRTIVERRPTAVAHHFLGEQLAVAGEVAEAERELRTSVQLGNSRAGYPLGALQLEAGRVDEAAATLQAFVASASGRQRFRWLEPPLLDVLQARLALAQIHAAARRWPDAAAEARQVLAVVPRHPEAQKVLGLALMGQQQWPDAIALFREYLATRPGDTQARINVGVALVATDRLADAVVEFQRAVQTEPGNPEARRLLDLALADLHAAR